jgi:hypothetical protein
MLRETRKNTENDEEKKKENENIVKEKFMTIKLKDLRYNVYEDSILWKF